MLGGSFAAAARVLAVLVAIVPSILVIGVSPGSRAGAGPVVPTMSQYPMTMPVTGMVESLFGGGCPSRRSHPGIDISNPAGTTTEIHAAYPGTAYALNRGDGYGLRVEIVHPFDGGYYLTRYAHLSQAFVSAEGQPVEQGDVIGMMGATGNAQVEHLHFEVRLGTAPGSDVGLDINSAFRPCRNNVVAGWPIPIDMAPLPWVPRHDSEEAMEIAAIADAFDTVSADAFDPVSADFAVDGAGSPRRGAPKQHA